MILSKTVRCKLFSHLGSSLTRALPYSLCSASVVQDPTSTLSCQAFGKAKENADMYVLTRAFFRPPHPKNYCPADGLDDRLLGMSAGRKCSESFILGLSYDWSTTSFPRGGSSSTRHSRTNKQMPSLIGQSPCREWERWHPQPSRQAAPRSAQCPWRSRAMVSG